LSTKKEPLFETIEFEDVPFENISAQDLPKEMSKKLKKKFLNDAKLLSEYGQTIAPPKQAYPNYDNQMFISPKRDVSKWIGAARELYYRIHKGEERSNALKVITSGWDIMEKLDFTNWLRFYQEGAQLKYKTSQNQVSLWENEQKPGYFVPLNTNNTFQQISQPASHPDLQNDQRRELIERLRNKVIGRLDSAEKLLRLPEGQDFAGNELADLLEGIYSLKKKVHLLNKKTSSIRLYEDMIIREANIFKSKGFIKSAAFLSSLAQALPDSPEANSPLQGGGLPGNIPAVIPGMPTAAISGDNVPMSGDPGMQSPPAPAPPGLSAGQNPGNTPPPNAAISEGLQEFLDGLDTGNVTFKEEKDNDVLDISDENEANDDLIITAQEALEPKSLDIVEQVPPESEKNVDIMFDNAMAGITVNDVVAKLEDVAKIFNIRALSRELFYVDMMLNQLGLASLFPTLGEAINKSLESNQYISTRIDDVLSRLRGTIQSSDDIDLTEPQTVVENPQAQQIKQKLEQENNQEKVRKKMRKEQENAELVSPLKETPNVNLENEMAPQQQAQPPAPAPQNV
jgi:hypothetical protein